MRIGTFGTGNMARVIGGSFAASGHQVMFGSRDASKAVPIGKEIGLGTQGRSNDDAAD